MLALAVALEAFQPVPGGYPQIVEAHGSFQELELPARLPFESTEPAYRFVVAQALGIFAGKASYHPYSMGLCNYSVKENTQNGMLRLRAVGCIVLELG